jgi:hypothetical protein
MLVSHALVPLIVVAEACSWAAVLTTNYLLHAIENSLWTLGAALALIAIALVRPRLDVAGKRFAGAAIVCSALYIVYMAGADVPMWVTRWRGEPGGWHAGISAVDGLRTALQRCVVSREWAAWRDDVPWLSLYFTVAVWISIALAHVPPLRAAAPPQSEREPGPVPTDRDDEHRDIADRQEPGSRRTDRGSNTRWTPAGYTAMKSGSRRALHEGSLWISRTRSRSSPVAPAISVERFAEHSPPPVRTSRLPMSAIPKAPRRPSRQCKALDLAPPPSSSISAIRHPSKPR